MRHEQYREGLLERLRRWRLGNPTATISHCRKSMRSSLTEADIDLLFDNWLNANFDRIEIKRGRHSVAALVKSRRGLTTAERIQRKRQSDAVVERVVRDVKDNMFKTFADQIWSTMLPNGTVMIEARGKDFKHASGWYAVLAKNLKPNEKVYGKFTTRQLFDLSQRTHFAERVLVPAETAA